MPGGETVGIALAAFVASFVGALSGFGFALLVVPPLAFLVGAKEAVVLANVLGTSHTLTMFVSLRRRVAWRTALPLVVAAWAGMPVGLLVLHAVSANVLKVALAVIVLAATLLLWRGIHIPGKGRLADSITGFTSGILNTSTSMNGPPIVLYLSGKGLDPVTFRATLAAFFISSSLFALALYAVGGHLDSEVGRRYVVALPGLALGWVLGNIVFAHLRPHWFRHVVVGVLLISGTGALVAALAG